LTSEYDDRESLQSALQQLSIDEQEKFCLVGASHFCAPIADSTVVTYLGYLSPPALMGLLSGTSAVFIGRRGFEGTPTTPTRLHEALASGNHAILHFLDSARQEIEGSIRDRILSYRSVEELVLHFRSFLATNKRPASTGVIAATPTTNSSPYRDLVQEVTSHDQA
jgi:hypothetical protein